MNSKETKVERVAKEEMLAELLAMIETCFEGSAIVHDGKIRMRLPKGEGFIVSVDTCE